MGNKHGNSSSLLEPLCKKNGLQKLQSIISDKIESGFVSEEVAKASEGKKNVRILTWNIWFEDITKERIDSIIQIITEKDPDFICL